MQTCLGARDRFQLVRFQTAPGERVRGHVHDTPHLFFLRAGDMEEDDGRNGAKLTSGGIRASTSDAAHSIVFGEAGADCVGVHFSDPRLAAQVAHRAAQSAGDTSRFVHAKSIGDLSANLLDHAMSPETILMAELDILELLASLGDEEPDRPDWLEAAHGLLRDPLQEITDISDIARAVGVSREHLARKYRCAYGTTLSASRRTVALTRSMMLMKKFDIPLVDVAGMSGFYDQAHLTNALKASTGRSPGQMRAHLTGRSQFSKTGPAPVH